MASAWRTARGPRLNHVAVIAMRLFQIESNGNYTWVSEKSRYTRPGLVWRRAQNQKDTRISERSGYV